MNKIFYHTVKKMPTLIKISTVPRSLMYFYSSLALEGTKTRLFFDDETDTWRECVYLCSLARRETDETLTPPHPTNPQYFLCKWKKEGENEKDKLLDSAFENNDFVFITCNDSYLFREERLLSIPSSLIEDNKWRNDVFHVGATVDVFNDDVYSFPSNPEWTTGVITETNTLHGQKYVRVSKYQYTPSNVTRTLRMFCIESRSLAPLHTHTTPYTEEEIERHLLEKYEKSARKAFSDSCLVSSDRWMMMFNDQKMKFTDELPWYRSLRMNRQKTATELILEQFPTATLDNLSEDQKCLVQLISCPQYDVAFGHDSYKNGAKHINYTGMICGDTIARSFRFYTSVNGLFDIKVKNATYAQLTCVENGETHFLFDMDKEGCDGMKSDFTLRDITIENPLFSSEQGCFYEILTDGDDVSTGTIYLNRRVFSERLDINYYYYPTFFPSKDLVVLTGHGLRGGLFGMSKISDLVRV